MCVCSCIVCVCVFMHACMYVCVGCVWVSAWVDDGWMDVFMCVKITISCIPDKLFHSFH